MKIMDGACSLKHLHISENISKGDEDAWSLQAMYGTKDSSKKNPVRSTRTHSFYYFVYEIGRAETVLKIELTITNLFHNELKNHIY